MLGAYVFCFNKIMLNFKPGLSDFTGFKFCISKGNLMRFSLIFFICMLCMQIAFIPTTLANNVDSQQKTKKSINYLGAAN